MSTFYEDAQNDALEIITEFGTTGQLKRNNGVVDIGDGTVTEDIESQDCVLVTVPPVDSLLRFDDQFKRMLAVGKARVFLIAAKTASGELAWFPEPGHIVVFDGNQYNIGGGEGKGGVMPINPAGTAVMFQCGCMVSLSPVPVGGGVYYGPDGTSKYKRPGGGEYKRP